MVLLVYCPFLSNTNPCSLNMERSADFMVLEHWDAVIASKNRACSVVASTILEVLDTWWQKVFRRMIPLGTSWCTPLLHHSSS